MSNKSKKQFPAHWVKAVEFANDLPEVFNLAIKTEQLVDLVRFLIADDTRRAELDAKGPHKLYSIQNEV